MATCQPTLPKHNLLAREDKRALSSFGQLVIYVNSINYDGDTLSVRGPVLICLLFIHSYLIFYFICSCFGCEWKSREPSTASEKKTLSAWRSECLHAAWPLRKRNRKNLQNTCNVQEKEMGRSVIMQETERKPEGSEKWQIMCFNLMLKK